MSQTV